MQKEIPEDLQIDILRRLPIASCIVRFRCVCKSWCALISNPSFTRQKLSSAADVNSDYDDQRLTMIINHLHETRAVYSLHSCSNRLEPILIEADLPFNRHKYHIAGSCNGLLCIHDIYGYLFTGGRKPETDVFLWNPATSETKVLPGTLFKRHLCTLHSFVRAVGFGFDPETNDCKIVRQIEYKNVWKRTHFFVEVYSLRNDCWKRIDDDRSSLPVFIYPQVAQCCEGKLYWWDEAGEVRRTRFGLFDLRREVLETADVTNPAAKWSWGVRSLLMLPNQEDSSLVAICSVNEGTSLEIWALLKFWVSESWTKLFTISVVTYFRPFLRISRNFLFYYPTRTDSTLAAYDLGTGEVIDDLNIPKGTIFQIMNYVPSPLSLIPK